MSDSTFVPSFVNRRSFIELDGRARAQSLLDEGTGKELVGPFDRIESPWLPMQGVVPQADDGCIVIKGRFPMKAGFGRTGMWTIDDET
jgi:malonate decarboxylase beta subunit